MPLNVAHERRDPKSHPDRPRWVEVEHPWDLEMLMAASELVERDGGPMQSYGSGYGNFSRRSKVEHVFSRDYEEDGVLAGDRLRFWRSRR